MFSAEITNYEDHQDISTGHSYTIYNIAVEADSLGKKWIITKRYKHFQYLYATLKTEYPDDIELNALHFPRKSMFHTFSDVTKAKRRNNFDAFIKVALHIYPMPLCVEDFLDIIDNCGQSYSHSLLSAGNTNHDKPLPYTYTPPDMRDRPHKHVHLSAASCVNDHVSSTDDADGHAVVSDILNLNHKDENKKMTNVLLSTFSVTTAVYTFFVFLGIVDIEGSNFGRLLLTAVSLGSTVSLMRISLIKRDIKKRKAFIREFKTALKAC